MHNFTEMFLSQERGGGLDIEWHNNIALLISISQGFKDLFVRSMINKINKYM